jgi:steroid 5-alpha reductase family enzyme
VLALSVELQSLLLGLAVSSSLAVLTWLVSMPLRNVSIVDTVWSLLIAGAGLAYLFSARVPGIRSGLVLLLLLAWAVRLSVHITVRNHGNGEGRHYQAIRARNQPGFAYKSLVLVFVPKAVLGWIVSLPLFAAFTSARPAGPLLRVAAALWLLGFVWEVVGDWQLARFKADPASGGQVMDRGLWRYSRHPNYFGECCLWWGFFLLAADAGSWWTIVSPLLMTMLLVNVSGISLLERDIGERRPGYRDYIRRTSAFIPWLRRA